ncbi:MAG: DNA-binding NarL/FixJ family response regulator [Flavobacteriaceae bacterium]|jgi:DNA-binding NarL/FixJ family response regulator
MAKTQKKHYLSKYHNALISAVENSSVLNKYLACQFLLKEDANLSEPYLKSISAHLSFFEELVAYSGEGNNTHQTQLSKELDLIKLQLDGKETLAAAEDEIALLKTVVYSLLLTMAILLLLLIKSRRSKKTKSLPELTEQEHKIKTLIENGLTNKEIALELFISPSTVKSHINTLYKKEGVHSRKELLEK